MPVTPASEQEIAFTSYRYGNYEIYAMNADGTGVTRLTTSSAWNTSPIWLSDGSKIAYESCRDTTDLTDPNGEIYSMNADGKAYAELPA